VAFAQTLSEFPLEVLLIHARLGPIANQDAMEITDRKSVTFGDLPVMVLHLIKH